MRRGDDREDVEGVYHVRPHRSLHLHLLLVLRLRRRRPQDGAGCGEYGHPVHRSPRRNQLDRGEQRNLEIVLQVRSDSRQHAPNIANFSFVDF